MWRSAWRAFLLLNGGNRWLGRTQPWIPPGFFTKTVTFGFFSSRVEKSTGGLSHQSTSPFSRAAARRLVAGDVVGEALVHHLVSRLPLGLDEPVRSRADEVLDLLVGVGG